MMHASLARFRFARRSRRAFALPAPGGRCLRSARSLALAVSERVRPAGEAGVSLIEVVISTLMVSIIAISTLTGFDAATRASGDQRMHSQATTIAQQDEERLRGLTAAEIGQLGAGSSRSVAENGLCVEQGSGKWHYCAGTAFAGATYSGPVFTVTSSAQYLSASKEAFTCETSGGTADYVQTTSSVSWSSLGSRPPVKQSSIVANPVKTALLVRVKNQNSEPLAGATITATGATTNDSQTTGNSGCIIFGGVTDKELTVAVADPGYVDHQGKSPPPAKTVSVSSTTMTESEFVIAQPASIVAEFESNGVAATGDTFTAFNSGIASPPYFLGGSAATTSASYVSSVQLNGLFPFAEGSPPVPKGYAVYAGDCEKNSPQYVASIAVKEAKLLPNKSTSVKLEVPAITVVVKTASGGSLVTSTSAKIINSECSSASAQNVSGTVPHEHVVAIKNGALEPKGQPYAKALTLCVVFKEGTTWWKNSFALTNIAKAGTNAGEKYVKTGGTSSSSELKC